MKGLLKKRWILGILVIVIIVIIVLILFTQKSINKKQYTAEELINKMKENNSNIGRIVVYDEETDLNELLGRPGQYKSKVTFEDLRVEQTNQSLNSEYFTKGEIEEPQGGTLEVFEKEEDMKKRKEYVEAVTSSFSALVEYSYGEDIYLLRLDKTLTPEQAKEYEELFKEIINSK